MAAAAAIPDDPIDDAAPPQSSKHDDEDKVPHRQRARVTFLSTALIIVIMTGLFLVAAPTVRLIESLICTRYYREHDPARLEGGEVPEKYCKINAIQDELGVIQGYQTLFASLPGLLLSIPFGVLADKYGRRNILVLTLMGSLFAYCWGLMIGWFELPARLMWFSSAFFVLGGGGQMIAALIMMVVADVTPEEERSVVFFRLHASVLLAEIFAPPLGSYLMERSLWIPLVFGIITHIFSVIIALFVPETRKINASIPRSPSTSSLSSSSDSSTASHKHKHVNGHREIVKLLVGDLRVTLLVITFLITTIGRMYLVLILQYVSKRYDWTLAQSSILLSIRAGANMVLLLFLLPAAVRLLRSKWDFSSRSTDSWIAKVSSIFMTLGFLGIALSPTPAPLIFSLVLFTFGSGLPSAVRSLVTAMVKPSHIGVLYTSIALVDTAAGVIAGPTMSGMFSWGLKMGKEWSGMAFLFAAVLHCVVIAIVFAVRVPERGYERIGTEEEEGEEEGEEEE